MSRASPEVGLRPGPRRVSPSLDLGLGEGRVAESGPGPGPRATLAGGGAGGACRRRSNRDGSGGWERRRVSEARETARGLEPRRSGLRPAQSRVRGLEMQSSAGLSALGDQGLTKPLGKWCEGRLWALGLMCLGAHSRLYDQVNPAGRCSDSRLHNDRGAAGASKSGATRSPSLPCRGDARVRFPTGLEALISMLGRQEIRFPITCLPYIKADGFGGLGHRMKVMFFLLCSHRNEESCESTTSRATKESRTNEKRVTGHLCLLPH